MLPYNLQFFCHISRIRYIVFILNNSVKVDGRNRNMKEFFVYDFVGLH
jgi:hypothetical protein